MWDFILSVDLTLFDFFNRMISNRYFDRIMPVFDKPANWIIPLVIFWILLMIIDKRRRYALMVCIPLVILLCDQTGGFIKDFELRDRPWYELGSDQVNHLGGEGGKHKSFPSNHAANMMGVAMVFSIFYRRFTVIFKSFAVLVAISRVYIGVHYPLDVLAGGFIGWAYGYLSVRIWEKLSSMFFNAKMWAARKKRNVS